MIEHLSASRENKLCCSDEDIRPGFNFLLLVSVWAGFLNNSKKWFWYGQNAPPFYIAWK